MKRLRNDSNIFTLTQSANRVNAFMTKSLKTSNNSRLKSTVPAKRKWLKMEFGPGHASIFVINRLYMFIFCPIFLNYKRLTSFFSVFPLKRLEAAALNVKNWKKSEFNNDPVFLFFLIFPLFQNWLTKSNVWTRPPTFLKLGLFLFLWSYLRCFSRLKCR